MPSTDVIQLTLTLKMTIEDFAIGLVKFCCFLSNSNNRRTMKSILLVKKRLGLVEMTSVLVNAPGGGGTPHMKGVGMLIEKFELNP